MVAESIAWDTLAGRLTEARTRRGLTRPQLAKAAGYNSASTVRRYERGGVLVPREDVVYRLAAALGVDPVWLLYGRGEPKQDANGR